MAFLCVAASAAQAQAATMFKCVAPGGKVSYSDRRCAPNADEAWTARSGTRHRSAPVPAVAAQGAAPAPVRAQQKPAPGIDDLRRQEMLRITAQQAEVVPQEVAEATVRRRQQCSEELDAGPCS